MPHQNDHHAEGARVIEAESAALAAVARGLNAAAFNDAVELMRGAPAHVVVTGMGKSGHIAAKIAATLASTGTPAFYLHPGEAVHGDLGMLTAKNVLLALSHSGATDEMVNLLPYVRLIGIPLIAITGSRCSPLGKQATVLLDYTIEREACPLNLAPTASTVAQLAIGDALAMALMRAHGFTDEDFAIRHPLGALGRRLLVHVRDIMVKGEDNPVVPETARLREAIGQMTGKRLGAVSIVAADGTLAGIFCDGDLRRVFERGAADPEGPIADVMTRNPKRTQPDILAAKAVDIMETHRITVLPVVDADQRPVGMIHLHQLIQAGFAG